MNDRLQLTAMLIKPSNSFSGILLLLLLGAVAGQLSDPISKETDVDVANNKFLQREAHLDTEPDHKCVFALYQLNECTYTSVTNIDNFSPAGRTMKFETTLVLKTWRSDGIQNCRRVLLPRL